MYSFPRAEEVDIDLKAQLLSYLNNIGSDVKQVIITIGSGPNPSDSYVQNIVFDSEKKHLIINIDIGYPGDHPCGLLKMSTDPRKSSFTKNMDKVLGYKHAVILYNDDLYYASPEDFHIYKLNPKDANQDDVNLLKSKCADTYHQANDDELELVIRVTGRRQHVKTASVNTDDKKYLRMQFDSSVAAIIKEPITDLLRNNVMVVIADFRSPSLSKDVQNLVMPLLDYYRSPNSNEGNLILTQGYFDFYPLFWPTKEYLSTANQKDTNDYSDAMYQLRYKAVGSEALGNYFGKVEDTVCSMTVLLPGHDTGILFSYPAIGEISKAKVAEKPKDQDESKPVCIIS
ncbi:hypothetical protein [Fluoribacter gormanii]|uniref:Uncharacterized protein n=2 Tax=Fluoribacter gormanii TaxID=464 RepID=A0A377GM04_9GAMM|nr:hypothetical protein [Fluoribacter gormanii]KTD01172.1 putative secreted esterase [Fluoribacter gormanii]SIR78492.1 hypothetical protein SAMN05421777_12452 [Fluoribacter gormanii]STO25525.1 Uncharacterised protein [Fluoribacter gormanii]